MCGIVGYLGKKDGAPVVIDGLKRLEYRGYDSWGIAAKTISPAFAKATPRPSKIDFHKQVGKIGQFELKRDLPRFAGQICIGHTRWATHGGVTENNSHPHFSCDKKTVVVHNGIIENYQELKEKLQKKGHKFVSQTDTEVIAHLIEDKLSSSAKASAGPSGSRKANSAKNFTDAVRAALKELEGSFALAILNHDEDIMIGARYGSPLVFGIGRDGFYLGSDVPAFLQYTNKVVFLDEMQMVEIRPEKYELLDIESGQRLKAKVNAITWNLSEAEKGGHPHFMIKEMLEQPTVLEKTIATDKTELERAAKMIRAAKRIYVVACGTALHAGLYGSYLLAIKNNIMAQPISAGELPYFGHLLKKGDLVICVSQSGETADVLEAVRSAHKNGAKVLALVNVMGSSLMRLADSSILTKAGPEICVVSTKAYVSQQAMFVMISSYLLGKPAEGKKALSAIKRGVEKILEKKSLENIKKIAKKLAKVPNLYSLGRGINFPNAMEAALKIKEVSYIHAEGFAGGDLKHGPIALIEPGVPVLVFVADDGADKEIVSNAMEAKARGAIVIGISFENNQVFETYLPIGKNGLYSPIESIVYAQLLSYYIALKKKLDPDKPRNLAKSVTVK